MYSVCVFRPGFYIIYSFESKSETTWSTGQIFTSIKNITQQETWHSKNHIWIWNTHTATKYLIGNNVYVTVNHLQDGSQLQFIEYMIVQSLSVPGQSVVCPSRLCMVLDKTQLQKLSSKMCLIKSAIKNAKKMEKPSEKLCDSLPEYATCLLTSSQKRSRDVTEGKRRRFWCWHMILCWYLWMFKSKVNQ